MNESTCSVYPLCPRALVRGCATCSRQTDHSSQVGLRKGPFWHALSTERRELLLMLVAGMTLAGGGLSDWLGGSPVAVVCYGITYLTGGWYGSIKGVQSLRKRVVDVDLLMILAALGAALVGAPFEGGMLLFLFSLSNVLQNHALSRSRTAIRSLMKLRPSTVLCETEGELRSVPVEDVTVGRVVRLRPGDRIALDGEVLDGETTVDESSLTGESMPVQKAAGSMILAGTINQSGSLGYRVTKAAKDSTLARIITLVEDAQEEKAQTQRTLEKAERFYATAVILLTLGLIFVPPLVVGSAWAASFYRAMTILVVASPCALIISTPAAFLSAIAGAAKRGVLFKGGVHLERLASVDTLAIDKTGTLTSGSPEVTDVVSCRSASGSEAERRRGCLDLLQLAASVESHSEHPIARAIERHCLAERCALLPVSGFQSFAGKGAEAMVGQNRILVGSPALIRERGGEIAPSQLAGIEALWAKGKTVVVVAETGADGRVRQVLGWIGVADQIREGAREVVEALGRIGVRRIVMLTGDNEIVAREVARRVGIDEVHAQLLPEEKLRIIEALAAEGTVAMIGDGVNDAPALAKAHVGIAMGAAGSDVAMETADVVLMSTRLEHLVNAFALAKKTRVVVTQNLIFALGVIVVLVATALFARLPLPLGVVGHEGSTVLVCLNGLRLLAFKQAQ